MKPLFDNLSIQISKMTTQTYSTSFSFGIHFLSNQLRNDIYSIYGFVRVADEIVDSFNGFDQKILLEKYKLETSESICSRISVNPILNSFQEVANKYQIDHQLIETFFNSMEMDLAKVFYNNETYNRYILGSAEVVGLMCLHVFAEGDKVLYEELKPYAMKLGSAFQKVNFLRDLKEDYQMLGRVYFPGINMSNFTCENKRQIEYDIEDDFKVALLGIKKLPASSKGGVYLAYVYYRCLFNKIKKVPAQRLLTARIRLNNGAKIRLMLNSLVQNKMNLV